MTSAKAILVDSHGDILMQKRDLTENIESPGNICFFGGAVENGETPEQAIIRELYEELRLQVKKPEVFGVYHSTKEFDGTDEERHVFLIRGVDPLSLKVREGRGYVTVAAQDDISIYPLSRIERVIIKDYFRT